MVFFFSCFLIFGGFGSPSVRGRFVEGLHKEAHRPEPVVARQHCRCRVLHPSVVKIRGSVGQRHDEGREGLPGAFAQPFGPLPALGDEDLSLLHVAGVFDRVFVTFDQVPVADLAENGDSYSFHGSDRFFQLVIAGAAFPNIRSALAVVISAVSSGVIPRISATFSQTWRT